MNFDPARFVLAAFVCGLAVQAGPITFTITDLGTLGGSASANAVNGTGQVAGTKTNLFGDTFAFGSAGVLSPAGSDGAIGASINSAGQIAGTTYFEGTPFATVWGTNRVRYIREGSYGTGINDGSQVTGMAGGHAFLSTQGGFQDLGTLPGGNWSSGYAVNNRGHVAGYGTSYSGAFTAFIWSGDNGMTALPGIGGRNSYALAINDRGQAAGSAQTASGYLHATIWTGSQGRDLGTLGGTSSFAYGLSAAGSAVGYSSTASGDYHAFLYANGVMYDLNSLLVASSRWTLTAAYGINENGQIAGSGRLDGVEHAVLLSPAMFSTAAVFSAPAPTPEPATWTVMIVALLVLASRASLLKRRD